MISATAVRRMSESLTLRRATASERLLLGGGVLLVVYYLIPSIPAGITTNLAQGILYTASSLVAAAAVVVGVALRRPTRPLPWLVLGAAQIAYAVADIIFFVQDNVRHDTRFPTIADAFYLLGYPLFIWSMAIFVRRRTPGWHLPTLIDASVVAIAIGLLGWVYVIAPIATSHVTTSAKVVSAAYPVMDLLVLVVSVRLTLGAGARPVAFYLITASWVAMLIADATYAVQAELGTYRDGDWVDAFWIGEYFLLGAAVLHPSMRHLDQRAPVGPPQATGARIAVLAIASLAAPAVLLIQDLRGGPLHVLVVAGACCTLSLLVLARMMGLLAVQRQAAITDGLTGLYSRSFFQQTLRVEADRAVRGADSLSLLLIDVDDFKKVNDVYGHPTGDCVLRELAGRLRAACRPSDVVARYGGEEFAVLMAGAAPPIVAQVAERVRQGVANDPLPIGDGFVLDVTVSIGAATLVPDATGCDEMIKRADLALYAAKRSGRNKVVTDELNP